MARHPGRHALLFILITIFIDTVAFGIIIPVMPGLIAQLGGVSISDAAGYGGWLLAMFAFMQFVFAPVLGNLSDRFGRRPVLLLSLTALGLDYLIMGLAPELWWLFVGRLVAGAASATFACANAYITDISDESERAGRFGFVSAAWGIGFVLGPALGGLLGEYGLRVPFFAAAGLALVNVLYGLLVLPETLPAASRRRFVFWRSNPFGAFVMFRRRPLLLSLFGVILLYFVAHDVNPSTWTYYVLHRFNWSEREVGLALAVVGLSSALVSGTLVGPIVRRLGERSAALLGLSLAAVGFAGFAFAASGWMLYPFILVGAFMGLVMPSLRSIMVRQVAADEQGALQGALSSLMALTTIGAPLLMTQLFRYFSGPAAPLYFPGMSFLLAALLCLVAAAVLRFVLRGASGPAAAV